MLSMSRNLLNIIVHIFIFIFSLFLGKSQNRDKSETVNIRTLGLAIVPGDQIFSISVQDTQLSNELLEHINISSSNNTTACSSESSISS